MTSIDWEAHSLALRKDIKHRVHHTKLVHDILPTNELVNKYDPHRSPKCPCCPHKEEDRDHILRCPHITRLEWRKAFLISLRKRCRELFTNNILEDILIDGLASWLQDTDLDPMQYPSKYHQLIKQQTDIGWRQIFNGRFSIEWARIQDDYLYLTGKADKQRSGNHWTTSITTKIWSSWYELWDQRNKKVHGHDQASQAATKRRNIQIKLSALYASKHLMLPKHIDHLYDNVDTHLQKPTNAMLNWYSIYHPMFKRGIKTAQTKAIQGVRSIASYFQQLTPQE